MNKTPQSIFLKDHEKLNILIKDLKKQMVLGKISSESMQNLRWGLERHFYVEEKILCNNKPFEINLTRAKIQQMMADHDYILINLDQMERKEEKTHQALMEQLKQFISFYFNHIRFEIREIYQYLNLPLTPLEINDIDNALTKNLKLGFYPLKNVRANFDE